VGVAITKVAPSMESLPVDTTVPFHVMSPALNTKLPLPLSLELIAN
jgi:hypothetical protein